MSFFEHHAAEQMAALTEQLCRQAASKGEGFRVFISSPEPENDVRGFRYRFDTKILAPGEPAPGSGIVYGPWPSDILDRANQALGELVGEPLGELADSHLPGSGKNGR